MPDAPRWRWKDREDGEDDFLPHAEALFGAPAGRGCPEPEMLQAAHSDVLPVELQSLVGRHLEQCRPCALLSRDLAETETIALTDLEEARIRKRVFDNLPAGSRPSRSRWLWRWISLPVAASLLLAVLYWNRRGEEFPSQSARQEPPSIPAAASPSTLVLTKPPLQVPAAMLVFRGGADSNAEALANAFAAYRRDDYAESARLLAGLRSRYPEMAEVHFFHGVSLLFLGKHAEAVPSLEAAQKSAQDAFAREPAWYLALAHYLNGDRARAAAELDKLCRKPGPHQTDSCAGLNTLSDRPAR